MKRIITALVAALTLAVCVQSLPAQARTRRAPTIASLVAERFAGNYRATPKTSIARDGRRLAPVKEYRDVRSLLAALPEDDTVRRKYPTLRRGVRNWPDERVPEELRNVRIKSCWLVAAKHEAGSHGDRDFHIVISNAPSNFREVMNVEITGLPRTRTVDFNTLKNVRAFFLTLADRPPSSSSFSRMTPPKRVEVEGSLFFDGSHGAGGRTDPGPAWAKPQTVWEIHPVYKLNSLN